MRKQPRGKDLGQLGSKKGIETLFFHKIANTHMRVNTIDKLKINEVLVTEPEEVKKVIIEYYENLYSETEDWRPDLNMRDCPMINEEDNNMLTAPLEELEIIDAIRSCARDKAPGPDGFTMAFFSHCWNIISNEVVAAIKAFHKEGSFVKSINATFVALIPKKVKAMELNDFRHIRLVGGVYKIIVKVLVERLKRVMHKLIDKQQMAFIKNRHIMDAVLEENECLDSR